MIRGMTSGAGSRWAGRSRRGSSCAVPVGGRGCVEVWVRRGRRWGRELAQGHFWRQFDASNQSIGFKLWMRSVVNKDEYVQDGLQRTNWARRRAQLIPIPQTRRLPLEYDGIERRWYWTWKLVITIQEC